MSHFLADDDLDVLCAAYDRLVRSNPLPAEEKHAALQHLLADLPDPAAILRTFTDRAPSSSAQLSESVRLFIELSTDGSTSQFPTAHVLGHDVAAWRKLVAFAQEVRSIHPEAVT